jgi:hypothetical protein
MFVAGLCETGEEEFPTLVLCSGCERNMPPSTGAASSHVQGMHDLALGDVRKGRAPLRRYGESACGRPDEGSGGTASLEEHGTASPGPPATQGACYCSMKAACLRTSLRGTRFDGRFQGMSQEQLRDLGTMETTISRE